MFGARKKRVERLSAGAEKNLEDGESIRELVQTQTGQSAAANASMAAANASMMVIPRAHVLVATDRNLYAMKLSGVRLLDVGDVVLKAPLDKADLYQGKETLTFGGMKFYVMGLFGEHAGRLYDYVKRSGGATESRRSRMP